MNDLATMFGRLAATATSVPVPNDRSKLVAAITAHVA